MLSILEYLSFIYNYMLLYTIYGLNALKGAYWISSNCEFAIAILDFSLLLPL